MALIALAAVLVFIVLPSIGPYTELLWFREDGRYPQVFWLLYQTKGTLFSIFFAVSLAMLYLNLGHAFKIAMVYTDRPVTVSEVLVSRLLSLLHNRGSLVSKVASLVFAVGLSASFSSEWMTYLRATHGVSFHKTDPIFGLDLSFFVFSLPWYLAIVRSLFGLFLLTTILTTGVYVALRGIATVGRIDLGRDKVSRHVLALIGLCVVTYGCQMWLERFRVGLLENTQFVGGSYTAVHVLALQGPMAMLMVAVGLVIVLSPFWKSGLKVAAGGAVLYLVCAIIGYGIYPAVLNAWVVAPNRITLESPYASKAISMTRFAYGLDAIDVKNTEVQGQPSASDLANSQGTLDNVRLWDPEVLQQSVESLQGLKPYYRFNDVDIDRYTLNGKKRMVMLAPRDISVNGLAASAQNWVNTRLEYTHGYGVTMSPVNTANANGQPDFLIKDIPPTTPTDLPISQPRIYFSDFRDTTEADNYVLVDTKVDEFDYPSQQNNQTNRWTGDRGIRLNSFVQKLVFSIALSDVNILISPNVTENSRLLMHRSVLDRAGLLYPFLSFDRDPYMIINGGRLFWIIDGYTTTGQIPYSAYSDSEEIPDQPNYIRNPVKIIVDAYTGDTTAYAIQPDEPLLQTYESIYPGLIRDLKELPPGFAEHFRYPEDLFRAQTRQLTQYHVPESEPVAFLNNEDAWDLPTEKGSSGQEELMAPYYVQMRLPSDAKDEFLLILPFTPRAKGNMSGWLAAHCDPDEYGKLYLYEYQRGSIVSGPKQMEANFNQNPKIANLYTLLKNESSSLAVGNLIVMPVGNSVMYAEPMFLSSASNGITAIPELGKVVLGLSTGQIVVADNYATALKELFADVGTQVAAPPSIATPSQTSENTKRSAPSSPGVVTKADVQALLQLANQADDALRKGDFAKYGDYQKQLRTKLENLSK